MEAPRTLRRFVRRVVMSRQDVVPFCSPPFAGFLSLSNNPGHLQTDLEQVRSYILSRSHCHVLPRGFAASTVDTGPGIIYRSHPSPARVSRPDSQPVQVSFCDVHRITTCSDISGLNDFFWFACHRHRLNSLVPPVALCLAGVALQKGVNKVNKVNIA